MRELKRGVWWTVMSVALLVGVTFLVYWDYSNYMEGPISTKETRQVKVVIARNSTLSQVVDILNERELIKSPNYFRIYLLVNDLAGTLKAGGYYFTTDMSPMDIASLLAEGPKTPFVVLTIKEGYNIWQVIDAIQDAGIATTGEVTRLLQEQEFVDETGVPVAKRREEVVSQLEGFLFPETYYIAPGQDLRSIMARVAQQSLKELREVKRKNIAEYSALLEEVGLNDHDLFVIASLVERETALVHEKRLVASVIMNRLHKGMLLQIDPTLTYTEEKRGRKPTAEDKKDKANPFNTYVHMGLPPGPICNPSRESLAAAVAPAHTDFLYFVAKRDGSGGHHFTTNYQDHKSAVKQYLKKGK